MSAPNKTIWDNPAHVCLLQAIVTNVTFKPEEWERILEYTQKRGYSYTSGAVVYL